MKFCILKLLCVWVIIFSYSSIASSDTAFNFSESSINSDPSDWLGLDESQVFLKKLSHEEAGHSWVVKVGKGGQLYSIKLPALGELVAYQREKHGQWIDEVFQHTLPTPPQKTKSKSKNTVVDGDIHQAGYYVVSDLDNKKRLLPQSVYSPVFSYQYKPEENSISYTTWPQHAHLPRRYSENLIFINQTIKDMGQGVIEISLEYNKWGGARNETFSLPWSAFRTSVLPKQVRSHLDGSYSVGHQTLREKKQKPALRANSTGGWLALVSSDSSSSQGIGIVYGKDRKELDNIASAVTMGSYGPPNKPEISGTVAAVYRKVSLDIGETLYYRYYLVLGKLSDIQEKANKLESQVVLKKTSLTQEQAERMRICQKAEGTPIYLCDVNEKPNFLTFKEFVAGAKPLFLLQDTRTDKYMLTENPYEISFNPTDGMTDYADLLGWVVPESMVTDLCRYQPLSEAISKMKLKPLLGKDTSSLYVMRNSESACVSTPVR